MPRIIVIFSIMIMFNLAFSQNQSVVVVFSHNTNGILENCHCPERSYGALEKRAAVIDSIRRAEKGILLVDTGDILDIRADRLLHEYLGHLRAGNSIYKLACEADSEIAASLLSKLERERYEHILEQYRIESE